MTACRALLAMWVALLALVQQPLPRTPAIHDTAICRGSGPAPPAEPDHACPPCLLCAATAGLALASAPPALPARRLRWAVPAATGPADDANAHPWPPTPTARGPPAA